MYEVNDRFSYAEGCWVFPKGFVEAKGFTDCDVHSEKDYDICFKSDVPDNIRQRFIKEYAEYHKEYMDKFLGKTAQQ